MKNINIEIKEIIELTNKGWSDEKIAQYLKTTRKHIQNFRHLNDLSSGTTIDRNNKKLQIKKLLLQGISGGEIARTLNISPVTIAKIKKEDNIKSVFDMKLSSEQKNEAIAMAKKGILDPVIAKKFNVTAGCIQSLRKRHGIKSLFTHESLSKINNQDFEKLFYLGWNDNDIAKILNVTTNYIYQYRYRHGYKRPNRNYAKNNPLTTDNIEILLGLMMGDGSMECSFKNARLKLAHCEKQKLYTYFIAKKLENLNPKVFKSVSKIDARTGKQYKSYWCQFPSNPAFNEIYNHFYKEKKKRIPIELFDNFTWQSLAFLYMDDGSNILTGGATIATNCFLLEDIHKFQGFLKGKFNLDTTLHKDNVIYITTKSFKYMIENIEKYMCDCMKYKINNQSL